MNHELEFTGERMVPLSGVHYGVTEHLHRYAIALELTKGKNVLDIACGEGYGSFLISKVANSVIGVDISEEAIHHAAQKYQRDNLKYLVGSADQIPVADHSVDIVVSFETLEHHDKHDEMFLEIKRVLKSDIGILLMSSPEKNIYGQIDGDNQFHIKEITLKEFKLLVSKYFSNSSFFNQQLVHGSLLTPLEESETSGFESFNGTYSSIQKGLRKDYYYYNQPFFNIVVASDGKIEYNRTSFFDGADVITSFLKGKDDLNTKILNTKSYKIGNFIVSGFLKVPFVSKWFKKGSK
jgi:ubiquinone/menaquinone biosynthesis C-methylase UbiE